MSTRARYLLGAAACAAYAAVSHQLMTRAPGSPLALAAVLGPVAGVALLGLWQGGRRLLAGVLAMCAVAAVLHSVDGGRLPAQWLYLAQHAGVHLCLGAWFGSTLLRGRQPLISRLAERVHHGLQPTMARYTRSVTLAWALYFLAMAAVSLALYAAEPFAVWSLFANALTPLSAVAMFCGEHLLRYRLHPEFERIGIIDAMRAYASYDPATAGMRERNA
jgi:uncharacterized membrane protein